MTIFIAHADADKNAADDLKSFFKSRAQMVETENGERGFRHLGSMDVVVALWSGKSVFSQFRMMFERRTLDAWAAGKLVLVKLDHSFLPVGLRDLPAIDASFAVARGLTAWPQTERAVRKALTSQQAQSQQQSGGSESGGEDETPPAPEPGAPLFISYAHADRKRVDPVVQMVESAGRKIWIDQKALQGGDAWAGEIVRGIKGVGGIVIMCSKRAFESDHIKREVYLADRYKKKMLPVFLEQAEPPEDFEYFFAAVQWVELFKLAEAERAGAIRQALMGV
jgi:hypothetical protein